VNLPLAESGSKESHNVVFRIILIILKTLNFTEFITEILGKKEKRKIES